MAFLILLMTSVYSFFLDKDVKGKPDAYSLISCVAFAIASFCLSRLSHFGSEVDLLYFFSGVLIVQFMKIKLWLVIVGGSFSYSLIILRSILDPQSRIVFHGLQDQDHAVIEIGPNSQSQEITIATDSRLPQPVIDSRSTTSRFMCSIEALQKENKSVIDTISKHVGEYLKANVIDEDQTSVPELHLDENLLIDVLPRGIVNGLHQNVKQMVLNGFKKECLQVYTSCRREFLKESLSTFGLQFVDVNIEDVDKMEKIDSWIKALNIAARILFPNERKLCHRVLEAYISSWELVFREICTELAIGD
ncbi:hypothetical protein Fmac_031299 [Flemingia macrophylla]|uniref:Exocyst subunit Exo70 family protein n=1 Tax=Flemingia macrophylla TaxID=520843 RepID=A0ABD1L233_9FABA